MKNLDTLATEKQPTTIFMYKESKLISLVFYVLLWFGGLFGDDLFYREIELEKDQVKGFAWGVIYLFIFGGFDIMWALDLMFGWYGIKLTKYDIVQEIVDVADY